jgi:ribose-phosphate pyrophosphokinase
MKKEKIFLLSGSCTKYLTEKIAKKLKIDMVKVSLAKHNDGEIEPSIEESVKGSTVFIVQSTFTPGDNILELLLLIDAAKRASASSIVVVIPYYGYGRADKKTKPRISIGAKLIADLLEKAGASRIMTMDLHADQIQGFFDIPVDHLYASYIFIDYMKKLGLKDLVIASPDAGGAGKAGKYAEVLGTEMVICYKTRSKPGVVKQMRLIGDVKDKNVFIVDDIMDTGGTITKAAELMMKKGAKSVRAFCTHPVLSGDACKRLEDSPLKEIIITDSIPLKCESKKITVLSTANLLAESIKRVLHNESISSLFID